MKIKFPLVIALLFTCALLSVGQGNGIYNFSVIDKNIYPDSIVDSTLVEFDSIIGRFYEIDTILLFTSFGLDDTLSADSLTLQEIDTSNSLIHHSFSSQLDSTFFFNTKRFLIKNGDYYKVCMGRQFRRNEYLLKGYLYKDGNLISEIKNY